MYSIVIPHPSRVHKNYFRLGNTRCGPLQPIVLTTLVLTPPTETKCAKKAFRWVLYLIVFGVARPTSKWVKGNGPFAWPYLPSQTRSATSWVGWLHSYQNILSGESMRFNTKRCTKASRSRQSFMVPVWISQRALSHFSQKASRRCFQDQTPLIWRVICWEAKFRTAILANKSEAKN